MQIAQSESISISYLRVIALIAILSCHVLQALDNRWAWVLNIGVQIFFFISGYLYGHKDITNWIVWYKRRIWRVYIPFLIMALFCLFCYIIFLESVITKWNFISYITATQWFGGGVKGLGHLWFITAILLCYLMTPLLQSLKSIPFISIFLLFGYSLYELLIMRYNVSLFIPLFIYSFGYFYANLSEKMKKLSLLVLLILSILILSHLSWPHILIYDGIINQTFHTYVGIFLSVLVITILGKYIRISYLPHFVKLLDSYSFEIYLVHHPLILGPMSLMTLTGIISLNICLILILVALFSYTLKKICVLLSSTLNTIYKNENYSG